MSFELRSRNNRYLTVRDGVVLSELTDEVIASQDSFFEAHGIYAEVSSGTRTAQKQLNLIIQKAKTHKIDEEFPSILTATLEDVDSWLNTWGRILSGYPDNRFVPELINPPTPQRAPFDYMRAGELRKAGRLIDLSGHQRGEDFDIGGRNLRLGIENDLESIGAVVKDALTSGHIPDLIGYVIEHGNGAVHCDCNEHKDKKF